MVTATLSYRSGDTKFYIAEPKTPLENKLQHKSYTVENLFISRLNKSEELRQLRHPKSPQPY